VKALPAEMVRESDLLFLAALLTAFAILWVYSVVDAFRVAFRSERSLEVKSR